jgi:hypothetical protein
MGTHYGVAPTQSEGGNAIPLSKFAIADLVVIEFPSEATSVKALPGGQVLRT